MQPRLKTAIFLAVAGMLAVGTAFLVRAAINAERANAARPPVEEKLPGTYVLVAARELMPGQFIKPDRLRWQSWPDDQVAGTYVVKGQANEADFVGAVVRTRIAEGAPVIEGQLVRPGDQGFLAAVLTPGMRAVTVTVNATTGNAGFVFPGDRVDLLLTHAFERGAGNERVEHRASETVLEDIRVLAIDQRIEDADGKPQPGKTATLEVTPRQAETVVLAESMGKLSLSLRSLAIEQVDGTSTDTDPRLANDRRYTWDTEASRVLSWRGHVVHVLRADKAEEVSLDGGR